MAGSGVPAEREGRDPAGILPGDPVLGMLRAPGQGRGAVTHSITSAPHLGIPQRCNAPAWAIGHGTALQRRVLVARPRESSHRRSKDLSPCGRDEAWEHLGACGTLIPQP